LAATILSGLVSARIKLKPPLREKVITDAVELANEIYEEVG
jgi:hypothetical protein